MCYLHNDPNEAFLLLPDMATKRGVAEVWETDELLRCPLVGICLSPVEQKHVLKKAGLSPASLTPFEMHELLVNAVGRDSPLSRKIGRLLRSKYEREATRLRELEEPVFLAQWKKAFAAGRYTAFIWAAATRKLSDEARRSVYGAIHMAMHGIAEEQMCAQRQVAELERKNEQQSNRVRALKEKEEQARLALRQSEEARRVLAQENASLREEREKLKAVMAFDGGWAQWQERGPVLEGENAALRAELARLTRHVETQGTLVRDLLAQTRSSKPSCPNGELSSRVSVACAKKDCLHDCTPACPAFDLCRKRVLIVGGVERMEALYREFIEGGGGLFDYHDGSLQGGSRQLERSLRRADVIVCPVNCNSHGACIKVKNLAKKHKKTFYMLPNASLSTLSRLFGASESVAGVPA